MVTINVTPTGKETIILLVKQFCRKNELNLSYHALTLCTINLVNQKIFNPIIIADTTFISEVMNGYPVHNFSDTSN